MIKFTVFSIGFIILFAKTSSDEDVTYNCVKGNGEMGLCKLLEKCNTAQRLITKYPKATIAFTLCGYEGSNKIICCGDVNEDLKQIKKYHWTNYTMRPYEKNCLDYTAEKIRLENINSERQNERRIVCNNETCIITTYSQGSGFEWAYMDEFPHMAQVGWEGADGLSIKWFCGGSLISEHYVLTAAHCLHTNNPETKSSEPKYVRLGGRSKVEIMISDTKCHPDYKPPKKYNDIALLKLSHSIKINLVLRPACLSTLTSIEGMALVESGHGKTSTDGEMTERLQKINFDVYYKNECDVGYPANTTRGIPDGVIESQFCAGDRKGVRDTCQGDSGGPLQIFKNYTKKIYEIVGITSFGKRECGSKEGGVYTKVSQYIDWIEQIVWPSDYYAYKYAKKDGVSGENQHLIFT